MYLSPTFRRAGCERKLFFKRACSTQACTSESLACVSICVSVWGREAVIEVAVQYGCFTLTSKHDLWRHNENCHSS